eukprot:scaffold35235_cov63-Phaeocystis_antarctica.AAC.1
MLTPLLTYQLTYLLTCLEVARRLAARMEDASERDQAGRGRVAMDAVHGDRVVAAVGGEHEVAARVDRHAAAPVSNINWLSLRPAAEASSQRQIMPRAAWSFGQPRPTRRLGGAGRPATQTVFSTWATRVELAWECGGQRGDRLHEAEGGLARAQQLGPQLRRGAREHAVDLRGDLGVVLEDRHLVGVG